MRSNLVLALAILAAGIVGNLIILFFLLDGDGAMTCDPTQQTLWCGSDVTRIVNVGPER